MGAFLLYEAQSSTYNGFSSIKHLWKDEQNLMKTAGIIAEYNPFHHGHKYQIDELRRRTGADYVVIAMSGDFVQRGEPALYDKYTRTCMALNAGADLVLEIPAAFATSSAEDFAACGVALFNRIGVVDLLCFGSECGETKPLEEVAALLAREPGAYSMRLRELLAQGEAFPRARELAVMEYLRAAGGSGHGRETNGSKNASGRPAASLLSSPNNILGIEYIKALLRSNSRIKPYTIRRCGQGYHDTAIPPAAPPSEGSGSPVCGQAFASASAIRRALMEGNTAFAMAQMPFFPASPGPAPGTPCTAACKTGASAIPAFPEDFSTLINYRLLELLHSGQDLTAYADVSTEIAERIRNQVLYFSAFSDRITALKTRQYTYTRISRVLLHILLDITDDRIRLYRQLGYAPYARILGFRRESSPLLTAMKERSTVPLITKTADAGNLLSGDEMAMFLHDLHCSHVYQSVMQQKSGVLPRNEYTHSVIVIR